jgi:hypothetical protein
MKNVRKKLRIGRRRIGRGSRAPNQLPWRSDTISLWTTYPTTYGHTAKITFQSDENQGLRRP